MKKTNRMYKIYGLVFLFTVCCQLPTALAQGPGFGQGIEDTPVDGGAALILATAVGYGVKKIKDARTKQD